MLVEVGDILQDLPFSILQEQLLLELGHWIESDTEQDETYLAIEQLSPCLASEMPQLP